MATKMKRFLATLIALSLCAGHILIPAAAADTSDASGITVEASLSQVPEATPDLNVTVGESVNTVTNQDGITEHQNSVTTDWSGTNENGSAVTGSETANNFTGIDDHTGQTLYEGGSIQGSETITDTETTNNVSIRNDVLISDSTEEFRTEEQGEAYVETSVSEEELHTEGEWIEGNLTVKDEWYDEEASGVEESRTEVEIDASLPENVTITMTPGDADGTTIRKTISIEDVISGAITLPEDGAYTELKDENGNVIGYEIITTTEGSETKVTVSDPESYTDTWTGEATVTLPEDLRPGTEKVYGEDGSVIGEVVTEVVPTYNDDHQVVKYTVTKTTTIYKNETDIHASDAPTTQETATNTTLVLPAKPEASVTLDSDTGITTTVDVQETLDNNGAVTGYVITTTRTDAEGNILSTDTETRNGTLVTVDTTTITDPTYIEAITQATEVTTEVIEITAQDEITDTTTITTRLNEFIDTQMTQRDYGYVEIDGNLYFIYTGSMTVTEGKGHGDTTLMDPITPMESLFKANASLDLTTGGEDLNYSRPKEGFRFMGYGVDTTLNLGTDNTNVHQFRLTDANGKEYYALCIDFHTTIKQGHLYDIQDITSQDYYQTEGSVDVESAEKLRIIALNGYWGTADKTGTDTDVGSLEEVKSMLRQYLADQNMTESQINSIVNSLTPGQALAATQAALWEFGSSAQHDKLDTSNLVYNGWTYKNGKYVKNEDYLNTEYVYNALLALANDPNTQLAEDEGVEFLDKEDITGGAITVKSKVVSQDEGHANNDNNSNNDIYNTDLSFTLGIEPSKLNGDLIVTVNVGGEEVKKVRLAGADDPLLPLGRIIKNDDGSYTIPDVELAEGVSVNLNLSGTQDLGTGVFIYTSLEGEISDSQTLITLAGGERKVNLNMNMTFAVEEPDAEVTRVEGTETDVVHTLSTRTDTKFDYATHIRTTTTTSGEANTVTEGTVQTKVYADVTVIDVTTEETKNERSWSSSWRKDYDPKPDSHEDDIPLTEIPDEEVPLANVPKTGDISMLWLVLSGLSAGGLMLLTRKKED